MNEQGNLRGEQLSQTAQDPSTPATEEAGTPPSQSPIQDLLQPRNSSKPDQLITLGAWLIALSMVMLVAYIGLRARTSAANFSSSSESSLASAMVSAPAAPTRDPQEGVNLPSLETDEPFLAVVRLTNYHTFIPTRPRLDVITYTVNKGDSVFAISKNFNLKPESVLWANYDQLKDSPDSLSPGMVLNIPPIDGILYQWKEGDSVDAIASQYKAKPVDILGWIGNHLDLSNPVIKTGDEIMIPGGKRDFIQWVIPTIPRGKAGVSKAVYGPGACEGDYTGAYGTGFFIWPTTAHVLSGNDYWSGHLGIDIAAGLGDLIVAADSGVIVFAGWSTVGYGNMVMIDHGNGYQTVYGHLNSVGVHCGQSVVQGGYIGAAGSTGNSTGPHLHFEIRYGGGFVNPWSLLP